MATPNIIAVISAAQRFWNRVQTGPDNTCWEFQGHRNRDRYGRVMVWRKLQSAHRLAFFFANGWWPPVVMHVCDNPPCCNPKHLRPANHNAENIADMIAKGRKVNPRGESHGRAQLTDAQVREIRERYGPPRKPGPNPKSPAHELAQEYGVSLHVIQRIVQRKTWLHIL